MTSFTPVKKGEKIKFVADEWNAVRKFVFEPDANLKGQPLKPRMPYRFVKVFNGQSEAVPAYGVLSVVGPLHTDEDLDGDLNKQAANGMTTWIEVEGGIPTGEENEILCILQRPAQEAWIQPCIVMGATPAWVYVNDTGHLYAKAIPDNVQMLESDESGPVRLIHAAPDTGLQLLPVLLGLPNNAEPATHAKELFPAIKYIRKPGETYIICPGGRGTEHSIKTVHVLHVEERKVSASTFGSLPMAMSNFDAALADNSYGNPVLVCAPGEVESGTKYPVQRYDFTQEEWTKTDTEYALTGCPAYVKGQEVIIAGGQSAYYVSNPIQSSAGGNNGSLAMYSHITTPFWSINPNTGALETRVPRRSIISGSSAQFESAVVNQQKRFLKQNFTGIFYEHTDNGKPVEFIAVGGLEQLGYQPNAVVSYAMNSLGPILDCEHADVHIGGECEIFPDTPLPFGECGAVHVKKRRSGNMIVDCNLLVCIGGRYRTENDIFATDENGNAVYDENGMRIILYKKGDFVPHEKPWYLDLDHKDRGWKNDLWDKLPTPRWNAGLSEVVTTKEPVLDTDGNPTGEEREYDRIFLIGGRTDNRSVEKVTKTPASGLQPPAYHHKLVTKKGLTPSIEALNLTTGKWETGFPGLDGKILKPEKKNET